jgi:hypothetical protein
VRILLRLSDGSEEIREVKSAAILVDSWHLEITPDKNPHAMHFYVPIRGEDHCRFVVRPGACNSMHLEIEAHMGKIAAGDSGTEIE